MNAREGIKTHTAQPIPITVSPLKTMNAREGIKTGGMDISIPPRRGVKNNECP